MFFSEIWPRGRILPSLRAFRRTGSAFQGDRPVGRSKFRSKGGQGRPRGGSRAPWRGPGGLWRGYRWGLGSILGGSGGPWGGPKGLLDGSLGAPGGSRGGPMGSLGAPRWGPRPILGVRGPPKASGPMLLTHLCRMVLVFSTLLPAYKTHWGGVLWVQHRPWEGG